MSNKHTEEHSTDKCYLEYVEGYLTCTYNHKAGEECLMDQEENEVYQYTEVEEIVEEFMKPCCPTTLDGKLDQEFIVIKEHVLRYKVRELVEALTKAKEEEREKAYKIVINENYILEEWYMSSLRPDTITYYQANQRNMKTRNAITKALTTKE